MAPRAASSSKRAKRGGKKAVSPPSLVEEGLEEELQARDVVNRSDRVDLETAMVKLVAQGKITIADLTGAGLSPPRKRATATLSAGEAAKRATLSAAGTMGSFERLGGVEIELVLRRVSTADRLAASETCRGFLSLRGSPRIWRDFDLSSLAHPTLRGVEKVVKCLDLSQLRELTLATTASKDPFSSQDYVSLCGLLSRGVQGVKPRYLALRAKRFGDSDKAMLAAQGFVANLRGLEVSDVKENRLDALLKLTAAAPGLECLKLDSYQLPWQILLMRLAAQPRIQRGNGARSVLRRFHVLSGWSGSNVSLMSVGWILNHVAESFPDMTRLSLTTVAEMPFETSAKPTLRCLRVLRFRHAHFFDERRTRSDARDAPMSSCALAKYFARIEAACPALEEWETAHDDPYISRADQQLGKRPPAPPAVTRGSVAGRRYDNLRVLTLGGIALEPDSFDGLHAPNLHTLVFWASKFYALSARNAATLADALKTNLRAAGHSRDVVVKHDDSLKFGSYFYRADHGWDP